MQTNPQTNPADKHAGEIAEYLSLNFDVLRQNVVVCQFALFYLS